MQPELKMYFCEKLRLLIQRTNFSAEKMAN